jgi:ElaB/YqjD/DUF883 family membrane-anchored ribosome-binding protein
MENEAELIRQQMLETRTALTEKLETLEEEVAAKVKDTTDSVVETVETVKDTVENTVQTVSQTVENTVETVKETFDMSRQFEAHPWLFVGGAVAVGFIGGRILDNMGPSPIYRGDIPSEPSSEAVHFRYQAPPAPSGPSWTGELTNALRPAMSKLGKLAIGVTAGLIGEMIRESVPENLKPELGNVIDEVTVALGGKPVHFKPRETANQQQQSFADSSSVID